MQVGDLVVHLHLPWLTHIVLEARNVGASSEAIRVHGELNQHPGSTTWHPAKDWKVISESR